MGKPLCYGGTYAFLRDMKRVFICIIWIVSVVAFLWGGAWKTSLSWITYEQTCEKVIVLRWHVYLPLRYEKGIYRYNLNSLRGCFFMRQHMVVDELQKVIFFIGFCAWLSKVAFNYYFFLCLIRFLFFYCYF